MTEDHDDWMTTPEEREWMEQYDKLFADFFSDAITEKQFHAGLRHLGCDELISEMRDTWLCDKLSNKAQLARATAILNALPLEERRELRSILLKCVVELPARLGGMAVFDVFAESAGGICPDGSFTPPWAEERTEREKKRQARLVGEAVEASMRPEKL
jgi:hypothetical protein